jgi:hypothetical protein
LAVSAAITDSIYQSSPESEFEGDREVYMVGQGGEPLRRSSKRSSGRRRRKLPGQPAWPGMLKRERGTTACRMTQGHMMTNLGMSLLQGDTTQSSTHDALQTKTDSETGHVHSERKSVGSSTKENRSTEYQPTTPWLQGCSSTNSYPTCLKTMKKSMHM